MAFFAGSTRGRGNGGDVAAATKGAYPSGLPKSLGGSTADHIRPAGAVLFFSAIKKPRIVCEAIRGKKISGTVLLSHSQIYSTIAAGVLNHRVREGNGCFNSAMSTGKTKQ